MTVMEWDVIDGGILGALVRCEECPCTSDRGCGGEGVLHRPYRLPGGAFVDVWGDADVLIEVLDRYRNKALS